MMAEKYDYKGNKLTQNEDGEYSDIPERCDECHNLLSGDKEHFKDFTNQTVYVCDQCGEEIRIQYN
jgi:predicted nucleic acid binding AN1-type Zn finger protein